MSKTNLSCPHPPLFCTLSCARVIPSPGSCFELPPQHQENSSGLHKNLLPLHELKVLSTCPPSEDAARRHAARTSTGVCLQCSSAQLSSALLPHSQALTRPGHPGDPATQTRQQRAQVKGQKEPACHGDSGAARTQREDKTSKGKEYRREYLQQKTEKFHLLSSPDAPKHGQGERQTDGEKKSV